MLDSIALITIRFSSSFDPVWLHSGFILDSIEDPTLDSILDTLCYFAFDVSPLTFLL